jgi:hypothetical protein
MTAAAAPLGALTLSVKKAASLAANDVIFGVLDELNRGRLYLPFNLGFTPQTGDAAGKWLPTVLTSTAIQATDPVSGNPVTGQYLVTLQPGTADTVNVASVQTMRVDPNAFFLVATSTW